MDPDRKSTPKDLRLPASNSLLASLIHDQEQRQKLMGCISAAASEQYKHFQQKFVDTFSHLNQAVYQQACRIPYASKDWWRDPHDIIVSWSLALIIREENIRRQHLSGSEQLPDWLVTASLLHDRGYGIIAAQHNQASKDYNKRGGAHWDLVETRLLHSSLSRKFAEVLLFSGSQAELLPEFDSIQIQPVSFGMPSSERDLFLKVIETHDHPLIGRYQELPIVGRHHFDADSLYSISLSSFVKDLLSYLADDRKMESAILGGLCAPGEYRPRVLLKLRMARYFSSENCLPKDWDSKEFPLNKNAASFGELSRCIEPHSRFAKELTDSAFKRLALCCLKIERAGSIEEFNDWFRQELSDEFQNLEARIDNCIGNT